MTTPGRDPGAGLLERRPVHDLEDAHPFALVGGIGEEPEGRGGIGGRALGPEAAAGVGGVELALHLGDQLGEVAVVVDVGQEAGVGLLHARPVDAVHGLDVELLLRLAPGVLEEVRPLPGGVEVELGRGLDRGGLAGLQVDGHELLVGEDEHLLALPVELEVGLVLGVELGEELDLLLAGHVLPQVVPLLELRQVDQGLAVGGQGGAGEVGGVHREADDAVVDAVQVEGDRVGKLGGLVLGLGFLALGRVALLRLVLLLASPRPSPWP